ncbi:MAG: YlxR family protein [Dehalococcoidia bacterium]|nr:YlxR family protein [Dehalococcoidia bacterium]
MAKERHIPERSCVACGQKLPKRNLVRILRTPDGAVVADRTGKGAGRGAYLCWSPGCWQKGVHKGGLERSLKITLSAQDRSQLLAFHQEAIVATESEES